MSVLNGSFRIALASGTVPVVINPMNTKTTLVVMIRNDAAPTSGTPVTFDILKQGQRFASLANDQSLIVFVLEGETLSVAVQPNWQIGSTQVEYSVNCPD